VGRVHPSPHISLNGLAVSAHWSCPQAPGWMDQRGDIFPETGGFYPEGIKGGAHPCQQQFFGRRGKPVKKMRFVPAEKAFSIAKAMQGTKGCTVSVI
jgi:hypothetical protein